MALRARTVKSVSDAPQMTPIQFRKLTLSVNESFPNHVRAEVNPLVLKETAPTILRAQEQRFKQPAIVI